MRREARTKHPTLWLWYTAFPRAHVRLPWALHILGSGHRDKAKAPESVERNALPSPPSQEDITEGVSSRGTLLLPARDMTDTDRLPGSVSVKTAPRHRRLGFHPALSPARDARPASLGHWPASTPPMAHSYT